MRAARRRSKICGVLRRRRRASVPKGGAKFAGQCAAEHVRREEVRGDVAQRDGAAAAEQARHKEARDSPHNGPVLWSMRDAMRCEKMLHDARVRDVTQRATVTEQAHREEARDSAEQCDGAAAAEQAHRDAADGQQRGQIVEDDDGLAESLMWLREMALFGDAYA
ncbi:hypothetical protein FVE85_8951 [Porphyridium purpureum]|uniref:Uncharacterized protein n=1 Tax=Porphyridium purpureum TaxID=35688 RepID=A0A5J4YHC1_PORPP|nr:hypothetical protein FVE85_8951 [Porphyridium purpureum]|eukprot:POR6007..scf282_42